MSIAYLAFVEFARCTEWKSKSASSDSGEHGGISDEAFDLAAVFSRFRQSDFFDARLIEKSWKRETSWNGLLPNVRAVLSDFW